MMPGDRGDARLACEESVGVKIEGKAVTNNPME